MFSRNNISLLLFSICLLAHSALAETVEIGAVLQLSGSQSEWGRQAQEGADTAVELINESGLLSRHKLKIIYEDGKGAPTESLSALRRLISIHNIQAFLTQASPVTMSLAPVSNNTQVIQFDVGSVTPAYRTNNDYTFGTAVTALQLANGLADTIRTKFDFESCAIIYVNDDYGEGVRKVFANRFKKFGGTILREESFLPTDSDFKTQLLRIRKSKTPALVVTARYDKLPTILTQARSLGIKAKFFGDVYSIENSQVFELAGEAAEGFTYVAPKFSMTATAYAKHFTKRFRKLYKRDPVQLSAQAHDAVYALALAAKACSNFESSCLKEKLFELSFEGASGRITFDKTGDVNTRPIEIRTVKNGKFIPLNPQEMQ